MISVMVKWDREKIHRLHEQDETVVLWLHPSMFNLQLKYWLPSTLTFSLDTSSLVSVLHSVQFYTAAETIIGR